MSLRYQGYKIYRQLIRVPWLPVNVKSRAQSRLLEPINDVGRGTVKSLSVAIVVLTRFFPVLYDDTLMTDMLISLL